MLPTTPNLNAAFGFRWVTLPILGYVLVQTARNLHGGSGTSSLIGVALLSFGLLLTRLNKPAVESLWAWTILFIFVCGYFYKCFWLSSNLEVLGGIAMFQAELAWITPDVLLPALNYSLIAFIVFCVTALTLLGDNRHRQVSLAVSGAASSRGAKRKLTSLLLLTVGLILLTGVIQETLGIGIMGIETQHLPLRLDTVLFRLRSDIVPALLIFLLSATDRDRFRTLWRVCLCVFFINSVMTGFLSTSRGAVVAFIIPVVFLWLLTNTLNAKRCLVAACFLIVSAGLHPVLSELRYVKGNQVGGVLEAIGLARDATAGEGSYTIGQSLQFMFLRITSVDSILFWLRSDLPTFSVGRVLAVLSEDPVQVFYTREIVGVNTPGDFRAPGMIGEFLVLAGDSGAVVLLVGFLFGVSVIWKKLLQLPAAPALLATFSFHVLQLAMEGIVLPTVVMTGIDCLAVSLCYQHIVGLRTKRGLAKRAYGPRSALAGSTGPVQHASS